jgi:hypothetical protein
MDQCNIDKIIEDSIILIRRKSQSERLEKWNLNKYENLKKD